MKQAGAHTRWKLYAAAFAAPVLLLAAVYAAAGFAPFGDKTLLTVDMNGQYVACLLYTSSIQPGHRGSRQARRGGLLLCLCRSTGQSRAAGEGPVHRDGGGAFCRPLYAGILFCKSAGPLFSVPG